MNLISSDGYKLFHEGALAFGVAERNGIRIDMEYCNKTLAFLEQKEEEIRQKILKSKAGKTWKKMYGSCLKLGAVEQLRDVLKAVYGIEIHGSLDKNVISKIDAPVLADVLELRKLTKARSTYMQGIMKETVNGMLHPSFNLQAAVTYRSSSSNPNFQNIPIRDPFVAELIRKAFLPRRGNRMVEADYSGIEVRVAACYHKDPRMLKYLKTGYDMHREMAAEVYNTDPDDVSKTMRYAAKNRFVFPAFYGSYSGEMGPQLWDAIEEFGLKTEKGVPVKKQLATTGIKTSSEFLKHIEEVEKNFWYKKFRVYNDWKKEWWELYLKRGSIDLLTGFTCRGYMRRNEVINYAVQGSAFHCLLWSFIQLTKALKKRKMGAKLIGQIHDSIIADVPENEFDEFTELLIDISTKRIRKHWDWIILPLEVEIEASDVNQSWFYKKEIKI